jgi:hypothetical protein
MAIGAIGLEFAFAQIHLLRQRGASGESQTKQGK